MADEGVNIEMKSAGSESNALNSPTAGNGETTVPKGIGKSPEGHGRRTKDIMCLIFFLLAWAAFIAVGVIGFVLGDPKR